MVVCLPEEGSKRDLDLDASEFYFFNIKSDKEGNVNFKEPETLKIDIPFSEVAFCNTNLHEKIFAITPDYILIPTAQLSIYILIQRNNAYNNANTNDLEALKDFITLKECKKRIICVPVAVREVVIRGEQIFFASETETYIYTPFSTTIVDIPSTSICSDYYIYFLDKKTIRIYGNSLVKTLELSHECSGICVIDGLIFVSRESRIYKVKPDGTCDCFFEANSNIKKMTTDPTSCGNTQRKIYAILATGRFLILNPLDMTGNVLNMRFKFKNVYVTNDYVVLGTNLNSWRFISKKDYSCVYNSQVDPELFYVGGFGDEVAFLALNHVIIPKNTANKTEVLATKDSYIFSELLSTIRSSSISFNEGIDAILEGKGEEILEEEENSLSGLEDFFKKYSPPEDPPEEFLDEPIYFSSKCKNPELEKEFEKLECFFASVKNRVTEKIEEEPLSLAEEYKETLKRTGITNPPPHQYYLVSVDVEDRMYIYYRMERHYTPYRKSMFFHSNFTDWLEKNNYDPSLERPIDLDYSSYDLMSSITAKKEKKAEKPKAPRKPTETKRRGGF